MNDGIDWQLYSLRYPTVDQAVAYILLVSQGAVLAKVDVAHVFHNILVHPEDRHLLGMHWGNDIFIGTTLLWFPVITEDFHSGSRCPRMGLPAPRSDMVHALHR